MNGATSIQSVDRKKKTSNVLSMLLLLCGTGLLSAQFVLQKMATGHGEQKWTDNEQTEFRELQALVHQSPARTLPSGEEMSSVYKRMDALDAVRIERRDQAAARARWMRYGGIVLIVCGLAFHFAAKARDD